MVTPTTTRPTRSTGRWLVPVVADLGCVLALAVGGKSSHDPGESAWVVLAIVWPFAVATVLAHGWLVLRGGRTRRVWPEGAVVLVATYVLGMLLRAASGRGTAPGFLVVAAVFLAVTMLGWRIAAGLVTHLRAARAR